MQFGYTRRAPPIYPGPRRNTVPLDYTFVLNLAQMPSGQVEILRSFGPTIQILSSQLNDEQYARMQWLLKYGSALDLENPAGLDQIGPSLRRRRGAHRGPDRGDGSRIHHRRGDRIGLTGRDQRHVATAQRRQ